MLRSCFHCRKPTIARDRVCSYCRELLRDLADEPEHPPAPAKPYWPAGPRKFFPSQEDVDWLNMQQSPFPRHRKGRWGS